MTRDSYLRGFNAFQKQAHARNPHILDGLTRPLEMRELFWTRYLGFIFLRFLKELYHIQITRRLSSFINITVTIIILIIIFIMITTIGIITI